MRKTSKKLFIASLFAFCSAFVCLATPIQASAEEVTDFDCTYSVPEKKPYFQYGASEVITYTAEEAQAAGIPEGYSGTVVSIKPVSSSASGSGILLDFTAWAVPVDLVESISFRFYLGESSKNTNGKPQLRISSPITGSWIYQPGSTASVTGEWATETVTNTDSLFDDLADEAGNLDKFELSVRVSDHVPFYIDSVTLDIADNDGVAPEISCSDGDAITIALGSEFALNASAYDAQEKCEKPLEYVWENGVTLDENGTPTQAGEYTLTLCAVDYFGNKSEKTITVTVIEPDLEKPVITPYFTEMYAQVGMIPNLKFEVTDNQKLASVSYAWSEGALNKNGGLTEGTHTYTITAKDTSDNETVLTITVFVTQDEHIYDNLIDEETLSPRFTVTFDGENGTVYKYGQRVKAPADPTREDTEEYTYVFEGWYNGDTPWDFDTDVVINDINLVSKWTEIALPSDEESSDSSEDSSDSSEDSSDSSEDSSDSSEDSSDSSEDSSDSVTDSDSSDESSDSEEESSNVSSDSDTPDESSDTDSSSTSSTDKKSNGCFSAMNAGILLPALLCSCMVCRKKSNKEDE